MRPDYDIQRALHAPQFRVPPEKEDRDDGLFGTTVQAGKSFPMISGLDHVVVLLENIEAGARAYEILLGRAPSWRSEGDGSNAVLFTLQNMSLELMAPEGNGPAADHIREVIRQSGEGLASICFRVDDIAKMHRRLERLALKPEPVAEAESRDVGSGATLRWKRTRAATDFARGVRLFFLKRSQERPQSVATANAPVLGLDHVVISTGDPERAAALYGARLGLDMALDRSHPEWGRLMFFRCGDLIVELVQTPHAITDPLSDKLWGLSWRVADIDAARARLVAAGIGVSEVRAGRRPGTRVMSVREATCGVHTLLLEKTEAA
jgi:catechol 2,3-dioxygenase-like lactoylglutathione lyase family enzyme